MSTVVIRLPAALGDAGSTQTSLHRRHTYALAITTLRPKVAPPSFNEERWGHVFFDVFLVKDWLLPFRSSTATSRHMAAQARQLWLLVLKEVRNG